MIVLIAGSPASSASLARQLWLRGFDASETESPGIGAALEALEIADALVVELGTPEFPSLHVIEQVKRAAPDFPVMAIGPDAHAARAYLAGADVILGEDADVAAVASELHRLSPVQAPHA